MDVEFYFLNEELHEEFYIDYLDGFQLSENLDCVCKM